MKYLLLLALLIPTNVRANNAEHFAGGIVAGALAQAIYQGPLQVPKPVSRWLGVALSVPVAMSAGILDRRDKVGERMLYGVAGVATWYVFSIGFDF